MLTNVLRLVGHVVDAKRKAGRTRNPALALLPLSPNPGVFGGDGLVRGGEAELCLSLWVW